MTKRSAGTRYSERTKRRARRLYAERKWSKARIARELDVGLGAVRRWLSDLDADAEHNARRFDRQAILTDARHMTRAEVQQKHGCSSRWLSDLLSGKLKP